MNYLNPHTMPADLPEFPIQVLPAWLADHATALAARDQVPVGAAGTLALATVSAITGNQAHITVNDTWREPVTLHTAIGWTARRSHIIDSLVADIPIGGINHEENITTEAIAEALTWADGAITLIGTNLDGLRRKHLDQMLIAGHTGQAIIRSRHDNHVLVDNPAITLALLLDPTQLVDLATRNTIARRELVSRLLFVLPEHTVGTRRYTPVPEPVHLNYVNTVAQLSTTLTDRTTGLTIAAEGLDRLNALAVERERHVHAENYAPHTTDWTGKILSHALRLAAITHLAHHPHQPAPAVLDDAAVNAGLTLASYYHAQAAELFTHPEKVVGRW